MEFERYRKDFIKLFGETARYRHRYEVFRDFVEMSALSLQNALLRDLQIEEQYLQIVKRYESPDLQRFPQLLALLVDMMESRQGDILGSLFMELEMGSDRAGQFFTPYHVSLAMAKLTCGGSRDEVLGNRPFITVQEPACGAGGMIIAFAQNLREIGVNPQTEMWAHCTDIDPVPALMCYLQLTLLHIPATIVVGCTLRMTVNRTFRTPAHILGCWESRIHRHFADQVTPPLAVEAQLKPTPKGLLLPSPELVTQGQFDLFAAG